MYKCDDNMNIFLAYHYSDCALQLINTNMYKPEDIRKLKEQISPEEKVNALLGKKLQDAIDSWILEAIRKCKERVQLTLKSDVCKEPDKDIKAALDLIWYADVKVSSDYPWYNESYEWTTSISFKLP